MLSVLAGVEWSDIKISDSVLLKCLKSGGVWWSKAEFNSLLGDHQAIKYVVNAS